MEGQEWQKGGNIVMNFNKVMQKRFMPGFALVVRLLLGCMFLYSSLPKIRQPYDFLSSVYNYELVGPKLGLLVAMVLPWAELLVGICLVGGIFVSGSLLVSIAMGGMFSFDIASALYRGLNISCGCFSASSTEQIGYITLIRALVIMLISAVAYLSVVFL
jgi:putative oxidoreductase